MAARSSREESSILDYSARELSPIHQWIGNGGADPEFVADVLFRAYDELDQADDGTTKEYLSDDEEDNEEKSASEGDLSLKLREYQKELAEKALEGHNTIICAPTGSGKTWVALHIIMEHFKKSDGLPKKVAFLARTIPLVNQQYTFLCKYFPSKKVANITSQNFHGVNLRSLLPVYDILVMTPMILVNHITTQRLTGLGDFSLIVFDECHHTRMEEPYSVLMTSHLKAKAESSSASNTTFPQIVGLTASIGIEKAGKVDDVVRNILEICAKLDVFHLCTVKRNRAELMEKVPVPAEISERLQEREEDDFIRKLLEIMSKIEASVEDHIRSIQSIRLNNQSEVPVWIKVFMHDDLKFSPSKRPWNKKSQEYGLWANTVMESAKKVAIHEAKIEENIRKHIRPLIFCAEYLAQYNLALQAYDLADMRDVLGYLDKCFQKFETVEGCSEEETKLFSYFEELRGFVVRRSENNPNLSMVAKILMKHLVAKGEKARGIIFVQTRVMTEALVSWLARCGNEALMALNAQTLTGTRKSAVQSAMTQDQQKGILEVFKSGRTKLLVATSVAEEGIDVPECNLVIRYNYVGNDITDVQTRGRCRAIGGVSVLLAMGNIPLKEAANLKKVELMERAVREIQTMGRAELENRIKSCQKDILLAAERKITEQLKMQNRTPYKLVCVFCRNVAVESTNVRTIRGAHRVCLDRDLVDNVMLAPPDKSMLYDDISFVGKYLCMGITAQGNRCQRKLGLVITYQNIPFLALRLESFGIFTSRDVDLARPKKWKGVPYSTEDLSYDDVEKYLDDSGKNDRPRICQKGAEMLRDALISRGFNKNETWGSTEWRKEDGGDIRQFSHRDLKGAASPALLQSREVQTSVSMLKATRGISKDGFSQLPAALPDRPTGEAEHSETSSVQALHYALDETSTLSSKMSTFLGLKSEDSIKSMQISEASDETVSMASEAIRVAGEEVSMADETVSVASNYTLG